MEETIVNKVAESGIITLNLEAFLPDEGKIAEFDIKPFLFREMILREKDFRAAISAFDWQQYAGLHVGVFCSVDAIVPMWAYMLISASLHPFAASVRSGNKSDVAGELLLDNINNISANDFIDKRVVIKGCGDKAMPDSAFLAITSQLRPVVKSLMYGEPCSTVPVYKKK